jgi:5'-3' exonuclease
LLTQIADSEDFRLKKRQQKREFFRSSPQNNEADMSAYQLAMSRYEHSYYYSKDHPFYEKYSKLFKRIDYSQDKSVWKPQYYAHFFGLDKNNAEEYNTYRKMVCMNYLEGLVWTLRYYLVGVPSWQWYYRFRMSPIPSDIMNVFAEIKNINTEFAFKLGVPYLPFEQLMYVLPPQDCDILPKAYQKLLTSPDSPILEYYPIEYEMDIVAGEKHIYAEPLLPHIDEAKVKAVIGPLAKKLTKGEQVRNIITTEPIII